MLDDPLTAAPAPAFPGWEEIARSFARKYGIDEDTWARIGSCETGGTWDPNSYNRSSGASGLYQQMPQYWAERSARYGHPGEDIFDPWANIDVSTQMARDQGFGPWDCA